MKMIKTLDYLDMIKEKLNLQTDTDIAKACKVTKTTISQYRRKGGSFQIKTAVVVSQILKLRPIIVIADAEYERAQNEQDKEFWIATKESYSKSKAENGKEI